MKKLFFTIGILLLTSSFNEAFSQNWGGQNPLLSKIKPHESRGYICWEPVPSAHYVVNIFEKDGSGNLIKIGTKSTDKNYAKLDLAYLINQQIYYSISAYNNGNGNLISIGDVIKPAPPGGTGEVQCTIKCNGSRNAWELNYITNPNGTNGFLQFGSTYNYLDLTSGISEPYWQAISHDNYVLLEDMNHPYAQLNGFQGVYRYKHKAITEEMILLHGGPFTDAMNNPVSDGFLIEKQLDQYAYMQGSVTSGNPTMNICLSDINAWINFYNAYRVVSSFQTPNSDWQYFTSTLPSTIQCNSSGLPNNGASGVNHDGFYDLIEDWFDCVWENYETNPGVNNNYLIPCNDILTSADLAASFNGVEFEQLDNPASDVAAKLVIGFNQDGSSTILKQVGQIKSGLFTMYAYTSDGEMLSTVFEIPEIQINKQIRDYVKLEIAPNQVENEILKFKVSSEKDVPVSISVHKLNGQLLHSENTTLSKVLDLQREILLNTSTTPYNQLKVTLLFDDGSSLQKTAIKL